jgi:aspartyl-tRNA(Asn)/glutamyl-tRNA(Gln) amidotransferase subunit A
MEQHQKNRFFETVSSVERTKKCLKTIEKLDPILRAFITPTPELAMESAERADRAAEAGEWLGLLHGVPVAIKDNIDVAGVRCTSGSAFFADYVPKADAYVAQRLREAGAVFVGKTNLHEFAYGGTTQNEHYGFCRNPWDTHRLPGGSSGGSAVAVAGDMCVCALGGDTGASIRMPSALNGISGLRPTAGAVSNRGITPISPPHDTTGPMARSVVDLARLYATIAGYDPLDPTSFSDATPDVLSGLKTGINGVRIAVLRNFFFDDVDAEVVRAVRDASHQLEQLGAELFEVSLPGAENAQQHLMPLLYADAANFHRDRLEKAPEKFGKDVLKRLAPGRTLSAMDYARSMRWLEQWRHFIQRFFSENADAILTPTVCIPAPIADPDGDVIEETALLSKLNWAWPAARIPSLNIPCGFTENGLPIGLQLAAARWGEPLLLRIGYAYQTVTDWHLRKPKLVLEG